MPATLSVSFFFFFFNDTATTEIYTLSLHDALPISRARAARFADDIGVEIDRDHHIGAERARSEEHTSELQSSQYLVCRLLLEKTKNKTDEPPIARLHSRTCVVTTNAGRE